MSSKFLVMSFLSLSFLATSFMFANTAFAYPTIGDEVVFTASTGGTLTLSNGGFDGNTWTIFEDDGAGGAGFVNWTDDQIYHHADMVQILTDCVQSGYVLESTTVPAGTFQTCKVQTPTGVNWLGDVPFGSVKIESSGVTLELQSFQNGQP